MVNSDYRYLFALFLTIAMVPGPVNAQTSAGTYTIGYRYDAASRLVGKILPDPDSSGPLKFAAVRYTYDAAGRLVREEAGELASWQSESVAPANWPGYSVFQTVDSDYDGLDRKIRSATRSGSVTFTVTQYSYDAAGRPDCVAARMNPGAFGALPASACTPGIEGSGAQAFGPDRITKNLYDADGRRTGIQRAVGTPLVQNYATYTYSGNNQLTSSKDANGNLAKITYDGFDRRATWTFPSKTTVGQVDANDYESYSYDANDNRTVFRKRDGQVFNYSYDALNRQYFKDSPGSMPDVYYGYDLRGMRTFARFGSASGYGVSYVYDDAGRLTSTTQSMDGTTRTVGYTYDYNGNKVRVTHPDLAYFQYDYDALNRPVEIRENGSSVLADFTYNSQQQLVGVSRGAGVVASKYLYDGISRLTSLSDDLSGANADVTATFGYNPAGQIVARSTSNANYFYAGDPAEARGYAVNGQNQYTSAGGSSFGYDSNGNRNSDGVSTLTYDAENRLVSSTGGKTASLSYDPLGRLYQTSGGSAGMTRFLYDGDELIAEYSATGTLLRRYVHVDGTDNPIVWYEGSAVGATSRRYLQTDHQGSVVSVADSSGQLLAINVYDSWGNSNGANLGRFQYTGQILLPELGLYHYKARTYDPTVGRFLQTDPVGYQDDLNLYAYVYNDPLNRRDPSGNLGEATAAGCAITAEVGCVPGAVVGAVIDGVIFVGTAAYTAYRLHQALQNSSSEKPDDKKDEKPVAPPLPTGLVGDQSDPRAGPSRGKRHNSGPLTPENGGTGNASDDFDVLTGGTGTPAPDRKPGTVIGDNGVTIRPGKPDEGPRIDIPANGSKPPETLHYPPPPPPPPPQP